MLNIYRFERVKSYQGLREFYFFAAENAEEALTVAEEWCKKHNQKLKGWDKEIKVEFKEGFTHIPIEKGLVVKA